MNPAPKRRLAKRMRQDPTVQEARLWRRLRDRGLAHAKFRRQVPLGPYVVDFLCLGARLIVEADGPFHDDDNARDLWLRSQGFRVMRFTNQRLANDLYGVLDEIEAALNLPSPLAGEGGGEADG